MFGWIRNPSQHSNKQKSQRQEGEWFGISFRPENFIPGLIIGFIFGLFIDLTKLPKNHRKAIKPSISALGKQKEKQRLLSNGNDDELKMVLVVRQDLKMGAGKIASQCARKIIHFFDSSNLYHCSQRNLLRQWEQCGQPKIVVSCKNQQEMNRLKETAESIGLPTFVVADAGRTQVLAGSKTVLAVGPGRKASVDSVTGKLRLL
ncbi:Peptidyl-tRNA hydrolase [Macleaya cordata]|uniref:peptidyl-tRNA hydrolase n=1 Tax=Macleaya cordata TaxID=56857 RepID=A0A200RC13_MACCD|nr:Peptidyl-tRNA hydrolase [Macleaya cordata]